MRVQLLWISRASFTHLNEPLGDKSSKNSIFRVTYMASQRCWWKARNGRGRKRAEWDAPLHEAFKLEFDRLCRLGFRFSMFLLNMLAHQALWSSANDANSQNILNLCSKQLLHLRIDGRSVRLLIERFQIVSRARTGRHAVSTARQTEIEISVTAI